MEFLTSNGKNSPRVSSIKTRIKTYAVLPITILSLREYLPLKQGLRQIVHCVHNF